jgi:hypothetical protein
MLTTPNMPSGNRYLNMDRIGLREDGTVYFNGPTVTNQPIPSGQKKNHSLLSKGEEIAVSSTKEGYAKKHLTDGEVVTDERYDAYQWVGGASDGTAATCTISFGKAVTVSSVWIYPPREVKNRALKYKLEFSTGDVIGGVEVSAFKGEPSLIVLNNIKTEYVKISVDEKGFGQTAFGLSEIMIFGA